MKRLSKLVSEAMDPRIKSLMNELVLMGRVKFGQFPNCLGVNQTRTKAPETSDPPGGQLASRSASEQSLAPEATACK